MKKIMVSIMPAVLALCFISFSVAADDIKLTAEEHRLISQLQPPVTQEELKVYREYKGRTNKETVESFVATRKYFRDLSAKFSGKVDIKTAPPPPRAVSYLFTLNEKEGVLLMDIKVGENKKKEKLR